MPTGRFSTLIKLLCLSACFGLSATYAQVKQSNRFEIYLTDKDNPYKVLPTRENGALIYRDASTPKTQQLELIFIDTAFQKKWQGYLPVERRFTLNLNTYRNNQQYLLFHQREFTEINFHLYAINLMSGEFTRYIIYNYIPFMPTHFEVTDVGALVGGYFMGRVPVVIFFDFATQQTRVLPGLFNESGELLQLAAHTDNTFTILVASKNFLKQKTIWVKDYKPGGELIRNLPLNTPANESILFGRSIRTPSQDMLIAGIYGNRNSEYSRGLFIARVSTEGEQDMAYYNFADLENFFAYMKAKRQNRVKERIERKRIKGKKIKLQYRVLIHELVPYQNQFVLLGEAFYPRYKYDNSLNYGLATRSYVPQVFDGYQYTHAVILGINKEGKLLWDNSFEINDVRTFTLDQFVRMDARQNQIALLYMFDNKIRSKLIENSQVVEGKIYSPVEMRFEKDPSKEDSELNKLEYWYGPHFLAYGVQRRRSNSISGSNQKVFFINKVMYD
jgi:hypothetical protein